MAPPITLNSVFSVGAGGAEYRGWDLERAGAITFAAGTLSQGAVQQ